MNIFNLDKELSSHLSTGFWLKTRSLFLTWATWSESQHEFLPGMSLAHNFTTHVLRRNYYLFLKPVKNERSSIFLQHFYQFHPDQLHFAMPKMEVHCERTDRGTEEENNTQLYCGPGHTSAFPEAWGLHLCNINIPDVFTADLCPAFMISLILIIYLQRETLGHSYIFLHIWHFR